MASTAVTFGVIAALTLLSTGLFFAFGGKRLNQSLLTFIGIGDDIRVGRMLFVFAGLTVALVSLIALASVTSQQLAASRMDACLEKRSVEFCERMLGR